MSIKTLRQKYPEYNDIPDLELAERFYKKHYSDLDESEYFHENKNKLFQISKKYDNIFFESTTRNYRKKIKILDDVSNNQCINLNNLCNFP